MPFVVDLSAGTVDHEDAPDGFGGSIPGLRLLTERTPPGLDPYDPRALLYVAAGDLGGVPAPGLAKAVFLAKSPLTGVAGEAHALGPFAAGMRGAGARALAITGRAETLSYLLVEDGRVSCHPAGELRGLGTAAATDALRERHGPGAHVAAIGPAGEHLVRYAGIVTDQAYAAARYGLGAVFGAKNLKAIVCAGDTPAALTDPADPAALAAIGDFYRTAMPGNPLARVQSQDPGFAAWTGDTLDPGYASVRNFSVPGEPGLRLAAPEAYDGRAVATTGGCPGCPNDCLKVYAPPGSPVRRSGGLGQEAFLSLGWNLGLDDVDAVLEANARCNDLGLDAVSLGGTLAFAMECAARGLLPGGPEFGAPPAGLAGDVAVRGGRFGGLLAEGAARAARALGAEPYAMTVKGAELPCFDPRVQPGIGLGYAVTPHGPRYDAVEHDLDFDPGDGLAYCFPEAARIDAHPAPAGVLDAERGRRTARLLRLWSALDALNICVFASSPTRPLTLDHLTSLVTAVSGREFGVSDLLRTGQERLDLMRAYAVREGGGADELPARLHEEPITAGPHAGAVLPRAAFTEARAALYAELGWR
jgi:aldehyde:ferredoxin oxidoreductase